MILYLVFIFFPVNMRQDRLCCKKAQRDMDLFYVERNVRIFEKNISKIRRKWNTNLMTEFLNILPTEKSFTFFSDFVFHFFFNLAYVRNCTAVSLGAVTLSSVHKVTWVFINIYFFLVWKKNFLCGILNLKILSPLYPLP